MSRRDVCPACYWTAGANGQCEDCRAFRRGAVALRRRVLDWLARALVWGVIAGAVMQLGSRPAQVKEWPYQWTGPLLEPGNKKNPPALSGPAGSRIRRAYSSTCTSTSLTELTWNGIGMPSKLSVAWTVKLPKTMPRL